MIIQLGSIFGSIISNIGSGLSGIIQQAAPAALGIGAEFLQREINRKSTTGQRRLIQGQAVQALNTPGIAVARLGGTLQPVGGRVQRATFTPASLTPAQSPFGNIPLLPVGIPGGRGFGLGFPMGSNFPLEHPINERLRREFAQNGATMPNVRNGLVSGASVSIGPRFAQDEFGKTIMFVPLPDGRGFVPVSQARAMNLNPTRPFWRWNRVARQYEKIKPRRLNPFNFKATARAGRRVERTLDAVKELVRIEKKMTTGKVQLKKRKKRKC